MTVTSVHELLEQSAQRNAGHIAVEEPPHGAITYGELDRLSDRVRDRLCRLGVHRGDRVGIYAKKSIDAVAAIFGILKAGAAYVPLDPGAPAGRNAFIMNNCSVRAAIVESRFTERLSPELAALGSGPAIIQLDGTSAGAALRAALDRADAVDPAAASPRRPSSGEDLAYILYTSGSTGHPKGVMLSHRNALSFIDWCSDIFDPQPADRFSSHAPFHFDLSVLDLYLPLKHGATVVLIGDGISKDPPRLASLIADRRLSVWYSAPSILSLLAQYGDLNRRDYSALRLVLFAGEVFPVKHLRALKDGWPKPRYFNLYGPTETNVCTFYEIPPQIPEDRSAPYPIGTTCSHLESRVVDSDGRDAAAGQEGELVVAGPGVMQGYWNLPERNAQAFLVDPAGARWYRTGDVVVQQTDGNYLFLGRRDRMVKRRGYRVELGEIEAALYRHPGIKEAAVIAEADEAAGVKLRAFVSYRGEKHPSLIELKRFSAANLPLYMVPDVFSPQEALPKTSTDKIDYQRLKGLD